MSSRGSLIETSAAHAKQSHDRLRAVRHDRRVVKGQQLTFATDRIGLKFKLYSCEVLFNRGLSLIYAVRT